MKRFSSLVIAAAMLVLTLPALAQEKTTPATPDAPKQDYSKCFEIVGTSDFNFGKIDQDTPVEHVFLLKNNCGSVVELDNPRASCGCTAALLTEKVIQPGAEAKINVKFTPPRGTRGKVSKTVSVFVKGDSNPFTILRFSADVKSDLEINPNYIQLLGCEVGKPVSGTASIKNVTDADIEVSEMTVSMTAYADTSNIAGASNQVMLPLNNAKVTPATMKLKPGESKDVTITLTPEHKGSVNGSIRFKTAKSEGFLQVYGIVRAKSEGTAAPQK